MESFNKAGAKVKSKDITIKIDEPIGEDIDIKNDFGGFTNDDRCNGNHAKGEKHSDDSDQPPSEVLDLNFLEYSEPIRAIFASRFETELGYLMLIGNLRFTIYDVYDDSVGGTEHALIWDKQYRFDR